MFGASLLMLTNFGQTYFFSLFEESFTTDFFLSSGSMGTLYAVSTFASALALAPLGALVDRMPIRRYVCGVGVLVLIASASIALSPNVTVLALGIFLMRLSGQGLLYHSAVTSTARAFPNESGRALVIVKLGSSAGQLVIPILTVLGIGLVGWRWAWIAVSVTVVFGILAVLALSDKRGTLEDIKPTLKVLDTSVSETHSMGKTKQVLLAGPAMLLISFMWTGLLFYQGRLALEKGWSLTWLAGCFAVFALTQVVAAFVVGPIVDRFGSVRLLPYFLLPYAAGLLTLISFTSEWAAPVYLALTAISAAFDSVLATTVWVEIFGRERLGKIRSSFETVRFSVVGAAPFLVGSLLDHGVPLSVQIRYCIVYIAVSSILSFGLVTVSPQRFP